MRTCLIAVCLAFLLVPTPSMALEITLDRPGEREFIRDNAHILNEADALAIRTRCDKLLTDKATPIIVITIDRMADHGGAGLRIETFARLLFDQWEIGHAQLNGQTWNTGILLLVSQQDRKARIELGNGWGRDKDAVCDRIMQDQIIPRFKSQDFSGGIRVGVEGLDAMARELPLPMAQVSSKTHASSMPATPVTRSSSGFHDQSAAPTRVNPLIVLGLIGLAAFTAISLARSGSQGWAWVFWGVVLSLVGMLLYSMLTQSRSRNSSSWGGGSGGGFGGGSFGGGFSGGGGSTGSW